MKNEPITIYENEELKYEYLSEKDKKSLEEICKRIGKRDEKIFKKTYEGYKFTSYVGCIPLKTKTNIEILPKIFKPEGRKIGENEKERNIEILLKMLIISNIFRNMNLDYFLKKSKKLGLMEIFIMVFAQKLIEELERGIYRNYEMFEDNCKFLRGRLVVNKNLKQNYIHKERFYIRFDEFTEDNSLNRFFKYAVEYLYRHCSNNSTRNELFLIKNIFVDIGYDPLIGKKQDIVQINRLNERFKIHFNTSKMLIGEEAPYYDKTGEEIFNILFDMNDVFEKFIAVFLKNNLEKIFGKYYRIKIQEGRKWGTWQNGGYLKIIPDIVVYNENEKEVVVIDTKYKKMPSKEKSNLPSNDFYQIYTYCRFYKNEGYENVKGVLLYPQHIQEESKENAITIEKDKISIYFRKIDLSMLKERDWKDELVKNLKQVFKNLNGGV